MDYVPTSVSESPNHDALPVGLCFTQPDLPEVPDATALVDILRQALTAGTRSAESILRAATDAARVLSGANGTALALRTNGVILCRARSGDIAPEIGSALNVDSGISGECLRTATILVCHDAATDTRVDPDVCLTLGVRSIVVVPLRSAMGIAGILEAFSIHPNAFGPEQIDSLRALAEIAETAYDREGRSPQPPPVSTTPQATRPALFAPPGTTEPIHTSKFSDEYSPKRNYWIPFVVATAVLLISMVVWLTWREPAAETAASEAPARPVSVPEETPLPPAPRVIALKPGAGVAAHVSGRLRTKDVLQNAAEIEPTTGGSPGSGSTAELANDSPPNGTLRSTPPTVVSEVPPSVELAAPTSPAALAGLNSSPAMLPEFGARVSQGVTEGNLIRKVEPMYPQEARMQRLAGPVTLDATIAEDGSIRQAKVVSGPPLLAAAATAAVRQWRYTPSRLNGKPIEVQRQITIIFKLP